MALLQELRDPWYLVLLWRFDFVLAFFSPKKKGEFAFDNWVTESQLCLEFLSPLHAPGHLLRQIMLISVINRNPTLVI